MGADQEQWQVAEQAEAAWMWSFGAGPALAAAESIGMTVRRVGDAVLWALRDDPTGGFFCRAVGLGVQDAISADLVDQLVVVARAAGAPVLCLQPSPHAVTPGVADMLLEQGFAPGRTWEKLVRDASPAPTARSELRIEALVPRQSESFATVMLAGFGMPELMRPVIGAEVSSPGWTSYGAFDGETMVAAAAMFVDGGVAALSGAATLEAHRGRGAQRALMARRISDAAGRSVTRIVTETGSETPEDPNPSLHNMHWAGFSTLYQRTNWVRRLTG